MVLFRQIRVRSIVIQSAFTLGLCLLCACEKTPALNDFTYPLEVGNIWEYERTTTFVFYQDSAGVRQNLDSTIWFSQQVTNSLAGRHNFGDTLSTYEMTVSSQNIDINIIGSVFYTKTKDGLYSVAYRTGAIMSYPKQVEPRRFIFHNQEYNDLQAFSQALQMGVMPLSEGEDSIYFESPPVQALAFPFKVGGEWDYRKADHPWHMGRKVVARTNLDVDSVSYDCYQVNTLYDMEDDGEWDDDIGVTDYYSAEGLIQRQIKVLGILEMDSQAGLTGRKINSYDRYVLTDAILVNEN